MVLVMRPTRGRWWCPEAGGAPSTTGARRGLESGGEYARAVHALWGSSNPIMGEMGFA